MKYLAASLALILFVLPLSGSAAVLTPKSIVCEASASKKVITPGEKVTISWRSAGAMLWYGPSGEKIAPAGSMIVAPTKKTIYKFKMVGIGGNDTCGVRIRIAGEKVPA